MNRLLPILLLAALTAGCAPDADKAPTAEGDSPKADKDHRSPAWRDKRCSRRSPGIQRGARGGGIRAGLAARSALTSS